MPPPISQFDSRLSSNAGASGSTQEQNRFRVFSFVNFIPVSPHMLMQADRLKNKIATSEIFVLVFQFCSRLSSNADASGSTRE